MSTTILPTPLAKFADEVIDYVADFSIFPEVIGGATLVTPLVPDVTTPDTALDTAAATITTEDVETIPAAKGVMCRISAGTVGVTYRVYFKCTLDTGAVRIRALDLTIN